ncbi:MAG: hypoxanthine phosphoribosyltransferase [Proteobacteria bacterium]|nr:hypoxanthine phosphoribosyltransferase [Pseudomonadota bacterium]
MTDPELKLIFSQAQIASKVKELAQDISRTYAGRNPVLLGILNGVFMFYSDLIRQLTIPVSVDFVRLASYGAGSQSSGRIELTKDVELEIKGRDVLIVEDIADSGLTLNYLVKHLSGFEPTSVRICALIDKSERREVPVDLHFVGFKLEAGFLVGYGLDYNEQYRYLPEIYHLTLT